MPIKPVRHTLRASNQLIFALKTYWTETKEKHIFPFAKQVLYFIWHCETAVKK